MDEEASINKERELAKRSRLQLPALDIRWVMVTMGIMSVTCHIPRPLDSSEEGLVYSLLQLQAEYERPTVRALDKIDSLVSGEQTEVRPVRFIGCDISA